MIQVSKEKETEIYFHIAIFYLIPVSMRFERKMTGIKDKIALLFLPCISSTVGKAYLWSINRSQGSLFLSQIAS